MPEIASTDSYDPTRDVFKVCLFCGHLVEQSLNSKAVGLCTRHLAIYAEDIKDGFQRNRLKQLIDKYNAPRTT
jgi:hypothetical protein